MAVAKMQQVAAEIRQQWPLVQGIAIVQRVGRLEVGNMYCDRVFVRGTGIRAV